MVNRHRAQMCHQPVVRALETQTRRCCRLLPWPLHRLECPCHTKVNMNNIVSGGGRTPCPGCSGRTAKEVEEVFAVHLNLGEGTAGDGGGAGGEARVGGCGSEDLSNEELPVRHRDAVALVAFDHRSAGVLPRLVGGDELLRLHQGVMDRVSSQCIASIEAQRCTAGCVFVVEVRVLSILNSLCNPTRRPRHAHRCIQVPKAAIWVTKCSI